jgi:hypothetical protein
VTKQYSVWMFNLQTIPLNQRPEGEPPGAEIKHFENESEALEYAAVNKNKYKVVKVKSQTGAVIASYQDGKPV